MYKSGAWVIRKVSYDGGKTWKKQHPVQLNEADDKVVTVSVDGFEGYTIHKYDIKSGIRLNYFGKSPAGYTEQIVIPKSKDEREMIRRHELISVIEDIELENLPVAILEMVTDLLIDAKTRKLKAIA